MPARDQNLPATKKDRRRKKKNCRRQKKATGMKTAGGRNKNTADGLPAEGKVITGPYRWSSWKTAGPEEEQCGTARPDGRIGKVRLVPADCSFSRPYQNGLLGGHPLGSLESHDIEVVENTPDDAARAFLDDRNGVYPPGG